MQKLGPHLAYISILVFFWFSVGCHFFAFFKEFPLKFYGLNIAIHICIQHHFSGFSLDVG